MLQLGCKSADHVLTSAAPQQGRALALGPERPRCQALVKALISAVQRRFCARRVGHRREVVAGGNAIFMAASIYQVTQFLLSLALIRCNGDAHQQQLDFRLLWSIVLPRGELISPLRVRQGPLSRHP